MNRAGKFVENLSGEAAYRSYLPAPLPPNPRLEFDDDLINLLVNANRDLAKLNAISDFIPDIDLFLSMYIRKEALVSSQIEGTQCTLDDILDPMLDTNVNLDAADVINYISAVRFSTERLKELPLSSRLLRETHAVLLNGIRGEDKNPGEFRRSQNWIGAENCSLKDARYIPPNPIDMQESMSLLEKYMNEDELYDPIIRAGLIHYQFETIHPFLDGNGRIGRLLILLYLLDKDVIRKPVIYISYFLKKNQLEYYDRISEVRRTGNYEQWVRFFLEAVDAAAVDALESIYKLTEIREKNLNAVNAAFSRNRNMLNLLSYLEQHPVTDIGHIAKDLAISYNTASSAVKKLQQLGIICETTNASRNRVFFYQEYLAVLRRDTE